MKERSIKQSHFPLSVPMYTTQRILMWFLLLDRVLQEEGLCVHNMHVIVEKHFSISIAIV
jgi:hypothetical protein